MRVYRAIGRRERGGEFSGDLVASFLAANEGEADRKAPEAFLRGSRRATIENRVLHIERTRESPRRLLINGREHVHSVETRRPGVGSLACPLIGDVAVPHASVPRLEMALAGRRIGG